jgi:hypothetical protein
MYNWPPFAPSPLGCFREELGWAWAGCGPGGRGVWGLTWPLGQPWAAGFGGTVAGDPDRHQGWLL